MRAPQKNILNNCAHTHLLFLCGGGHNLAIILLLNLVRTWCNSMAHDTFWITPDEKKAWMEHHFTMEMSAGTKSCYSVPSLSFKKLNADWLL